MDSDIKNLLEENIRLSKANNELLVKLHNVQKWTLISRVIYWFILICIAVGAFYFIKPFLSGILGVYGTGDMSLLNPINSLNTLSDLLK